MSTSSKLKGFGKDSMIYGIGDGLGRLTALIMLPILSRVFVPADFGIIVLLNMAYSFLLMGIDFNISTGFQRFYYQSRGYERKIIISTTFSFLTLFAVITSILVFAGAPVISDFIADEVEITVWVRILALCMPLGMLFSCQMLLLRLRRQAVYFSVICILQVIIYPILVYILVVSMQKGIAGVFISQLITIFILTCILAWKQRKGFALTVRVTELKKIFAYAIPGYPAVIIANMIHSLPMFILALFAPLSAVGLFGVATSMAKMLDMYANAFHRAWNPFAFANFGESDEKKLYEIVFKMYAFSLIIISLGVSLYAKELLYILTPPEYHSAHLLVGGIAIIFGGRGLVRVLNTALYSTNQVKWTSYLSTTQLVVFLVSATFLVPQYHATGLIISLIIAMVSYIVSYIKVTDKYFPFVIPKIRLIILFLTACISLPVFNLVELSMMATILLKTLFVISFVITGTIWLLTKNERKKCYNTVNKYRNNLFFR